MDQTLATLLDGAKASDKLIIVLTGAGISAESGIPTFRGKEGYWTVGSTVYHPQQLATYQAFSRMPDEVWQWYLYRRTVCRRAEPNPAHRALVDLESRLGDRFRLITQNVDGLHIRAGNSLERTYQIHGNIDFMRCVRECTLEAWPIPTDIGELERDGVLSQDLCLMLSCPKCAARSRPHVLWFDESYDEPRYRWQSAIDAATNAALIVSIGTSASTNLPWQVISLGVKSGAALVDVNIADNPFAELAADLDTGYPARGPASELVPAMVDRLCAA